MLLKVENLTKRFGGLVAVSDISFAIEKGEIIGIFGPNGSGKTTLLSLLAGLLPPTAGRVFWKGRDIAGERPNVIASLGVIKTFQNPQLFSELSVFEHVMIASFLAFTRMKDHSRLRSFLSPAKGETTLRLRAEKALTLCRLQDTATKPAAELSYGEEKMLGVAMAMMCEPELLLLDEPASGLNPEETHELAHWIRDIRDALGITVVMVEHDMSLVSAVADRVLVMEQGQVLTSGTPAEVQSDPRVIAAYLGA